MLQLLTCYAGDEQGRPLQLYASLRAATLRAAMAQAALPSEDAVPREVLRLSELLQGGVSLQGGIFLQGGFSPSILPSSTATDQLPDVRICSALAEAPVAVRDAAAHGCQLLATWAQVTLTAGSI